MSGTSCDGIDAAVVAFENDAIDSAFSLCDFHTYPYDFPFKKRLLAENMDTEEAARLDFELGRLLGSAARDMVLRAKKSGIYPAFIASHGHTVAHFPPGTGPVPATMQIGQPALIAEQTGLPVVADFRPRDMAAGGQGAPLVPYVDWLLFRGNPLPTACLNIGGIANLTIIHSKVDDVLAFDTGPGNMLIDGAARILSGGKQEMDMNGEWAARGAVLPELLESLLNHPYFRELPPKSTGRETFGTDTYLRPRISSWLNTGKAADIMATVTRAVAQTIADSVRQHAGEIRQLVISGGGAHNATLWRMLGDALPTIYLKHSEDACGIPGDAREAVAFAVLGRETLLGRPGNVPGATGAARRVILGTITPA